MQGLIRIISTGIILTGVAAQAGQQLRLKSGTLDTENQVNSPVFRSATFSPQTAYQIVQFKSPIRLQDQQWLKSLDIEVLRYIPDDAYVARLNDLNAISQLKNSALIQAVVAYEPAFRINQKSLSLSVFNQAQSENFHLRFFKGVDQVEIRKQLEAIRDLQILEESNGAYIVNAPMGSANKIAAIEGLEWVDRYHELKLQNFNAAQAFKIQDQGPIATNMSAGRLEDLTGYETGTRIMNFKQAWNKGLTGKGQVVAVADTGLDTGDLATLTQDFSGLKSFYIGGVSSTTWGDPNGHGTHVSGSILNSGFSSGGRIKGGAYEASLVMESVYSERYSTITIGPDPSSLFQVAYDDGARIHSNSWGSIQDYGVYNDSARSVDEFMFANPDMLILFSAGNEGVDHNQDGRIDSDSITSPGTAKNALTVGASENIVMVGGVQIPLGMAGNEQSGFRWPAEPLASDTLSNNKDGLAAFSSRGPTNDGRLKPDVVAPGTNVLSNCSKYKNAGKLWGPFNEDYCYSGGTSMSTPLVAAAATLVRQNLMEKRGIRTPSASLIKAVLMHTAVDMYPGQYGEVGADEGQELLKPGPNMNQGYGRVDVSKAVSTDVFMKDNTKGLATGEEMTYKLPAKTRKVTLVYTDAPGSTAAEKALVNNLDLEVHTTTGSFFSSKSEINNSEQIVIPASAKVLKMVVKAQNVPMGRGGRQPYSLVYSQ